MSSTVKTDDEFGVSFNIRELPPDHTYTIQGAAFNKPHKCRGACNCAIAEVKTGLFITRDAWVFAERLRRAENNISQATGDR